MVKTVKALFDGQVFVPMTPIKAEKNQLAIITLLDNYATTGNKKAFLKYAGLLSDDSYIEINNILKDTQRIDIHEW